MQRETDIESSDRKCDGDKGEKIFKDQTMEYHLKAAHVLYCDEVRALKLQVKALKNELKENALRELKCSQCKSIEESLDQQAITFEEKLREKNEIICQLRHKLELNELQTFNGSLDHENHCLKKRRLLNRKDYITAKENQQQNTTSDDDIKILEIKPDCIIPPFNREKRSDTQYARNHLKSAHFVFVPDTLVDDMETKPFGVDNGNSEVVVPETLHMNLGFSEAESPLFNNHSLQITTIVEKSVAGCFLDNPKKNVPSNKMIDEILSDTMVNNVEQLSKSYEEDVNDAIPTCFCESVNKDLDVSMEEFQIESSRKGKKSKSAVNFEHQIGNLKNCNNFSNKPATARKVRTPSPNSKYKLHFSPVRSGHRKTKYKQTTLTQNIFGACQEDEIDNNKTSDYDLSKAIEESLRDQKSSSQLTQQEKMIADESGVDDNTNNLNHSCLDATFVPSQILKKTRFSKHDSSTKTSVKSSVAKERKVENIDADFSDSEDLLEQMSNHALRKKEKKLKQLASRCSVTTGSIPLHDDDNGFDDFDIVPNNKSSPNFKYKEPTVRKQNERRKLEGFECKECAEYVAAMGLGVEEKKKRLKECSRHRGKYALPATPDHFWSIDFPSTQECKERGVMNSTQYKPLRQRRRPRK